MSEPLHAVFLSYASQDQAAAQRICEALRAAGIEVWFDQSELRGGDIWDQKIRREIRDCALFIPIVSQHTQERLEGYFRYEWKLAVDRAHLMATERSFIVPVVIDDTREPQAVVSGRHRGDSMPLLREVVVEDLAEIGLVFDHQDSGHAHLFRPDDARSLDDPVTVV